MPDDYEDFEDEDSWEREYAYYLERRMEEQFLEEEEELYNLQLASEYEGCLDDEEVVITGLNNSEMSITAMHPSDYNVISTEAHYLSSEEEDSTEHKILHLPLEERDAGTIGEYLGLLLSTLWIQDEGFSAKRPLGNSDWKYPIYIALGKAGLVNIELDEDGYVEDFTRDEEYKADELILRAIKYTYNHM